MLLRSKLQAPVSGPAQGTAADGQTEALRGNYQAVSPQTYAPRHRHLPPQGGHKACGLPKCKDGYPAYADYTPGVCGPWIHTVVQYNVKRTCHMPWGNDVASWWKPGRFPSWRRPIAVTSSAEYLGQVTTPQASVSCPLQREDGTHASQLVLRRKDSCSRDPQSKAWPDKLYTECCHHWTGRCWSPPLSFHFQTWSQHADNMTRWAGKSWEVSQLWKKERFLGTHNK